MKTLKVTPITSRQYDQIRGCETFHYNETVTTKHGVHPEYGEVVLVSTFHGSCLMIHCPSDSRKHPRLQNGVQNFPGPLGKEC